jgi:hypothetical protein
VVASNSLFYGSLLFIDALLLCRFFHQTFCPSVERLRIRIVSISRQFTGECRNKDTTHSSAAAFSISMRFFFAASSAKRFALS